MTSALVYGTLGFRCSVQEFNIEVLKMELDHLVNAVKLVSLSLLSYGHPPTFVWILQAASEIDNPPAELLFVIRDAEVPWVSSSGLC